MSRFKAGDRVQVCVRLPEKPSLFAILTPPTFARLAGRTVTISEVLDPELEFYRIREDGGRYCYPGEYFHAVPEQREPALEKRRWSEEELNRAARMVCALLLRPDPDGQAVCCRFIDLVTPYAKGEKKQGKPRVLLLRAGLLDDEIEVFCANADDRDEPNVIIGMLVCLCKARGIAVPDWIRRPRKEERPA